MNFQPQSKSSLKDSPEDSPENSSGNRSKEIMRNRIRDLLAQEKPYLNSQYQGDLRDHLQTFMRSQQGGCWGGFQPLNQEPGWTAVCENLPHLTWAFPKIEGMKLNFFRNVRSFVKGPFHILEPADGELVPVQELSGCLVPGLAFSRGGVRLGRGRGFYDRALELFTGVRVGVCFSIQFVETEIPEESHDLRMNYVVTEKGVFESRVKE